MIKRIASLGAAAFAWCALATASLAATSSELAGCAPQYSDRSQNVTDLGGPLSLEDLQNGLTNLSHVFVFLSVLIIGGLALAVRNFNIKTGKGGGLLVGAIFAALVAIVAIGEPLTSLYLGVASTAVVLLGLWVKKAGGDGVPLNEFLAQKKLGSSLKWLAPFLVILLLGGGITAFAIKYLPNPITAPHAGIIDPCTEKH